MQKRAFSRNEEYRTLYEPLPTAADTPIYRDRAAAILPYAEDFPKLHFHDRYEIGICEEGEGLFLAEGEFFSVAKGDAVLLPPGKRHYSRSIDPNALCYFRFAYILPSVLRVALSSLESTDAERVLLDAEQLPYVLRAEDTKEIRAALDATGAHADTVSILRLCILLLEKAPTASRPDALPTSPSENEATSLAEHLSLHYAENESAGELAAHYHLSESQLRRKFVAAYGIPPIAYRNALRCKIGAELLLRTSIPIGAISERLGFVAPTEFYRVFRKQYGQSPSEFRRKNG